MNNLKAITVTYFRKNLNNLLFLYITLKQASLNHILSSLLQIENEIIYKSKIHSNGLPYEKYEYILRQHI